MTNERDLDLLLDVRRISRVLPVLVSWLVLAACGSIDPEESFALAESALGEHNYREATIHARNVLQANDNHLEARILLGRASLALGDLQDAEFHLSRAVTAGAAPHHYAIPLAQVHSQLGNPGAAVAVLDQVPEAERSDEHWVTRSLALLAIGDVHAANDALDRSLTNSAPALLARAQLAISQQDMRAAQALVRQAVEEDPNDPAAWSLFASVMHAAGLSGEAELALDTAAELYRTRGQYGFAAPALLQLVQIQFDQRKFDAAAQTAERLALRFPDSVHAHIAAGMVALRHGETQKALDALRQAAAYAPNHPEIEMLLGAANVAAGNLGQAEQRLQASLAAGSQNPAVVRLLAETRLKQGRPGPALEAIGRLDTSVVEADPALAFIAGIAHLENGDAANAVSFLERTVHLAPDNPSAVLQLARAYSEAGRPQDAARVTQALWTTGVEGGYAAKMALLLQTLRDRGESAANAFVDELLSESSVDAENLVVAATLAYLLRDRSAARSHLGAAFAVDPNAIPALLLAASLDIEDGMTAEAESKFRQVLELEQGNPAASMALARLRIDAGDEQAARAIIREAAATSTEPPVRLMVALGELERRLGAPEEALRIAESVVQRSPAHPQGHLLMASVQTEAGRFSEAAAAYRAAYNLHPSWQALQGAVTAYQAAGEGGWEALLVGHLQAQPDHVPSHLLLANALLSSGREGEALAAYDAVLKLDATNVIALNNAAWISYGRDNERSLNYAEQAFALAPESSAVLDTLGWILVREDRPHDAMPHLEKAVQLSPGSPEIRYHLAVALARTGQTGAARELLQALLSEASRFASRDEAQALLDTL